jgi:hypothetical protein
MSKLAAAITMPMTKADMQESRTTSMTTLVICMLPDGTHASPQQAALRRALNLLELVSAKKTPREHLRG